ncbi:porin [Pseudoalteromonas sp. MMG010]|uniref:porin n=1 Tax=Pseudoalteromonas sp. MMG010 TaxID=2822685 RepID=UPI001B3A2CBF|nr:porin [Pseudoalteromonas sp. MMG010]MBQ4833586.1 porin [Pseudoalteromonas sp. MMG010]
MKKLPLAIAACLALAANSANAEVRINGFASIVAGKSLDSEQTIYGYDDDISFKNESIFALQLSADLQESLTATAQIVARGSNDFDAEFEWAYLTYEFTDELQLSAGKMRVPFYRYSDFLDVGYAYRWVRPPETVYGLPFSTYEGLSLLYTSQIGDWDSTVQVIYGSSEASIDAISNEALDESELESIAGVNWSVSYDWFSARVAYLVAETTINVSSAEEGGAGFNSLVDTLVASGLSAQADELLIEEDDGAFFGIGFSIDYNDILFDTEYTQFEVKNSILAEQKQYYVSLGYRLDDVIVHVTYENDEDKHDASRYNQIASVPTLNAFFNGALDSSRDKAEVYTIGTRYDFHPSAALKVDYSHVKNNLAQTDVDVVSVAVDLVF